MNQLQDNSQRVTEFDDVSYWLELPKDHKDYQSKPKQAINCTRNCNSTLKNMFTKRLVRIAAYTDYVGIDYFDFRDLCDECKMNVYEWFTNDVWSDHLEYRIPYQNFEAEIEESNAASTMNTAYEHYQKMLEDYHSDNVNGLTKEEIEDYRQYYKDCEKWWRESRQKLGEVLKEHEAKKRGYPIE